MTSNDAFIDAATFGHLTERVELAMRKAVDADGRFLMARALRGEADESDFLNFLSQKSGYNIRIVKP